MTPAVLRIDAASSGTTSAKTKHCTLCGAIDWRPSRSLGAYSIVDCRNCGLARLMPFPDDKVLAEVYSKSYYTVIPPTLPSGGAEVIRRLVLETFWGYPTQRPAWQRLLARFLLWPLRNRAMPVPFDPSAAVLDIGCGNGQRLLELKHYGQQEVFGVEPCVEAADHAATIDGAQIRKCMLEDAMFPPRRFGLVIMNQVLEHVPSPIATLNEVRRILRPDGRLYLTVPNFGSVESRLFREDWYGICLPAHLHHFTPATLRGVLEAAGFEVQLLRTDSLGVVTSESFAMSQRRLHGTLGQLAVRLCKPIWKVQIPLWDRAGRGNMLRVVATPRN